MVFPKTVTCIPPPRPTRSYPRRPGGLAGPADPEHHHTDAGPYPCTIRLCAPRGRSSTAELQPSKLVTRVRFPSPARGNDALSQHSVRLCLVVTP